MKDRAIEYYNQEYNCSQSIVKAFGDKYGNICENYYDKQALAMCTVFSDGLGIGGFCGAIAAGIMIFGMLADKFPAKKMRICFLSELRERYPDFNCSILKRDICSDEGCGELIMFTSDLIDKLIKYECSKLQL